MSQKSFQPVPLAFVVALLLTLLVPAARAASSADSSEGLRLFRESVREVLTRKCLECHGGKKTKHNFDVTTRESLLKGSKHHRNEVVPGSATESHMMRLVHREKKPYMPPKKLLTAEETTAIERWIDAGAPYDAPLVWSR